MKQETQDIAIEAIKAAPGITMTAIILDNVVAVATLCFIVLQVFYLVRKWWREETEWGRKLKHWACKAGLSRPMELGDD